MLSKLKAVLGHIWAEIADTWERSKMYILGILVLIGTLEFRKLKEYLLAKAAQKEMKNDQKQDQVLATKEQAANNQANQLIQDAQQLPSQAQPVPEDWYTKKDSK